MIVFHALTSNDLKQICYNFNGYCSKRLDDMGLSLEITPAAIDMLVKEGSDFSMGRTSIETSYSTVD